MLADVLWFLSIYLVFTFLIYLVGFFCLNFFRKVVTVNGIYSKVFISLITGLTLLVCVFASFKTHLLTTSVFLPLVFFLTFYKKQIAFSTRDLPLKKRKNLLFFMGNILLLFFPFIWFASIFFKSGDFHFAAVAYDSVWYSELSNYLTETGMENKWGMFFSDTSSLNGIEPYHYIDSWLNAFCSFVFGGNSLCNFYLITYPILLLIAITGILAIIEHFIIIGFVQCIAAIFLLFIGPVYHLKTQNYHFNTMGCELPIQHFGEKFCVYYPFIILCILLVLNGYLTESLLFSLSLCIVSSTLLPAIVFFFLILFCFKKYRKELLWKSVLFFSLYFLFLCWFKTTGTSTANSLYMLSFTDFGTFSFSAIWFKLFLSNLGYGFFISLKRVVIDYFYAVPILIYLVFYKKDKLSKTLSFFIGLNLLGLLMAGVFYKLPDGYQLFTNTLPLLHLLLIACLSLILFKGESIKPVLILSWIFLSLFFVNTAYYSILEYKKINEGSKVSDDYMIGVKNMIGKTNSRQRIGFIYNQTDHENLLLQPDSNYLYHLSYLGLNAIPYRMSLTETTDKALPYQLRSSYKLFRENELYYSFLKMHKDEEQNSDSLKIKFIKSTALNYLLIGPTTSLPVFLSDKNSNIIKDSRTGICFVQLLDF